MLGKAAVLGLRAQQQNICQHVQAPELEPQHWKKIKEPEAKPRGTGAIKM